MQRRDAIAELAQRVEEARRVGAARDEAEHVAARLDQIVPADVLLDALENAQALFNHASAAFEARRDLAAEPARDPEQKHVA